MLIPLFQTVSLAMRGEDDDLLSEESIVNIGDAFISCAACLQAIGALLFLCGSSLYLFVNFILVSFTDGNNKNADFKIHNFIHQAVATGSKFYFIMIFKTSELTSMYMRIF